MDLLESYFAEHLASEAPVVTPAVPTSTHDERLVLFRIGEIRFALTQSAIAAVTKQRESACHSVGGEVLVPARYQSRAVVSHDHGDYIRLAGTGLGIGPCRLDGETVPDDAGIRTRVVSNQEPWIVATLAQPPSLVLEKQAVGHRLQAMATR